MPAPVPELFACLNYSVVFPVFLLAAQRLLAASESFFRPAAVSVPFRFGLDPVRSWPVTLSPAASVRVFRGVPSFSNSLHTQRCQFGDLLINPGAFGLKSFESKF